MSLFLFPFERVSILRLREGSGLEKLASHMEATVHAEKSDTRAWRWGHLILVLVVAATWLGMAGMNLWMGELNQDEGWYLYAAGQIRQGHLPYRDFAFTQPPLMPVVYSLAYDWIERFGVAGGRAVTGFFGALSLLAAVWLAMRTGPRRAQRLTGGICFILAAINLYQSYFTTIVKTYALSGMFLAAGLVMLSFVGPRRAFRAAAASGFLLACAAATRISLGAALALGGGYLLLCRKRLKPWAWLDFALGGGLGLALTLLPFMAIGQEGFRFGILEYHTLREAGPWAMQLAYKAGCLARLTQAYFPAAIISLFLLFAALRSVTCRRPPACGPEAPPPEAPPDDIAPCFNSFLWVVVVVLALVHLAAPFPYDDYQVPVYLIFCAALAATMARWWLRMEVRSLAGCAMRVRSARRLAILTGLWLVCSLYAFSSPLAQGWFVAGRDRIWWRLRDQSPVAQLQDMGRWVRELTLAKQGTELLTQDTYLAVEARLPVPHGLEMGPFSYYPDWPRERAEKLGVLNREMLRDVLVTATNAPIAAFSGYSLTIRSPEVAHVDREDRLAFDAILEEGFDHVDSVLNFGQASTVLDIWQRKLIEDVAAPAATDAK